MGGAVGDLDGAGRVPRVSVLVPVCNAERYLTHCLESLAAQTLADIEVVCVDDGSTDASARIIDEFVRRDPRFRVITKPNTGYGDSMNRGLEVARGAYVGILESDDFAEPDMFERLLRLAEQTGADVARGNYCEHESGRAAADDVLVHNVPAGVPCGEAVSARQFRAVLGGAAAIWSSLYRRAFLEDEGIRFLPTPGASFQDTSFNLKALMCARAIAFTEARTVHYRVDNTASSVHSSGKLFCVCDEYDELWRFLRERPALFEAFRLDVAPQQFLGYRWNMWRLGRGLRDRFYDRFVGDFEALDAEGLVDRERFVGVDRTDLDELLGDPDALFERLWGRRHVRETLMVSLVGEPRSEGERDAARARVGELLREEPRDVEMVFDDVRSPWAKGCLGDVVHADRRGLLLSELCLPGTADVPVCDVRGDRVRLARLDAGGCDAAVVRAARAVGDSAPYRGLSALVARLRGL